MRALLQPVVFVLALLVGVGVASAQQGGVASPEQKSTQEKAQHGDDGRAGAAEPSAQSEAAKQPTAAFVNGKLAVPGAPADSQTVPSTQSPRNARLDRLPSMAYPTPLTEEQKSRIRDAVGNIDAPVTSVRLGPADACQSPCSRANCRRN